MRFNAIFQPIVFVAMCLCVSPAQGGKNPQQPSRERTSLMQEAARLIANGNLAAAETLYDTILRRDSGNTQARLARGHVRAWQHKYDKAREDFLTVLRLDPNNLSAIILNLGVGCAPSCWPIFGFRNLLGARRGAEGSFLCS